MAAQPSGVSGTPLRLLSSAKLLRVHPFQVSNEDITLTWPQYQPVEHTTSELRVTELFVADPLAQ